MNLQRVFLQFPKWAIAGGIFLVSTGIFAAWWFFRSPELRNKPAPNVAANTPGAASAHQEPITQPNIELAGKTILVGDQDLYEFKGGDLHLLQANWLDSPLGQFDQAVFLEDSKRLIVSGGNHAIHTFDETGSRAGTLSLSNGFKFDGYIDGTFTKAVFVKDGNLWRGDIDWLNAKVVNETQATTLGYILGNPLKGRLLGAASQSLVYRDHRYGLVGIKLDTGESQQLQFPTNASPSPSGSLIVGDTPTRPSQLVVFDVNSFEYVTHPFPGRIQQNGLAWLSETKAALILNEEIKVYNHEDQSLNSIYKAAASGSRLIPVALPVQDQPFLMFQDPNKGIICLNTETKEVHLVNGPPGNHILMLNDGAFLLSSDVPNSEQRGTWLGTFGKTELKRILAQPMLTQYDSNRGGGVTAISLPSSSHAIVRAFNQWHLLDLASSKISDLQLNVKSLFLVKSENQ